MDSEAVTGTFKMCIADVHKVQQSIPSGEEDNPLFEFEGHLIKKVKVAVDDGSASINCFINLEKAAEWVQSLSELESSAFSKENLGLEGQQFFVGLARSHMARSENLNVGDFVEVVGYVSNWTSERVLNTFEVSKLDFDAEIASICETVGMYRNVYNQQVPPDAEVSIKYDEDASVSPTEESQL